MEQGGPQVRETGGVRNQGELALLWNVVVARKTRGKAWLTWGEGGPAPFSTRDARAQSRPSTVDALTVENGSRGPRPGHVPLLRLYCTLSSPSPCSLPHPNHSGQHVPFEWHFHAGLS